MAVHLRGLHGTAKSFFRKVVGGAEPQKSPEYLGDRDLLGRETNCSILGPVL